MINLESLKNIKVSKEPGLWIITMHRALVQNALDSVANGELAAVFDAFFADPEAGVAILTGDGAAFCSGHDYGAFSGTSIPQLPQSGFGGLTRRFYAPKVVVAAVNGDALDEGFELALACDLIIANEDARFAMQQALWGGVPREGGIHRLIRQIPLKKAMANLLTGTPITAAEGVLLGFVNDITGHDQVVPLAKEWAHKIGRLSAQSVRAIKQTATRGLSHSAVDTAIEMSYPELEQLIASPEYAASITKIRAARQEKAWPK